MDRRSMVPNATPNKPQINSYRSHVAARSLRNPCLQTLSNFLSDASSDQNACRIACLKFSPAAASPRRKNLDLNSLGLLLNNRSQGCKETQGYVLIIEDLSKDVIEMLGSTLDVDPLFFACHLDVPRPDIATTRPSTATLPSITKSHRYATLHYHRVLTLEHIAIKDRFLRDMNVPRKLKILPSVNGWDIGLARHCCSILETKGKDGLWLGIILVDASLSDSFISTRHQNTSTITKIQSRPFQGGYEDFLPDSPRLGNENQTTGPSRRSLLEDLIFYWSNRSPPAFDVLHPTLFSLSYYPLRIIAGEWKLYLEVMYHSTKLFEYNPDNHPDPLEHIAMLNSDLSALQKWARRSMASTQKIQYVLGFLRNRSHQDTDDREVDPRNLLTEDYEHLASHLAMYSRRLDSMAPIVTSLIQIIDSQRSLTETAKISRLSNLALVFVPLSFVSSLFSMNQGTMPGSNRFWLYLIVAVPLSLLVLFIARPPRRILRLVAALVGSFRGSVSSAFE